MGGLYGWLGAGSEDNMQASAVFFSRSLQRYEETGTFTSCALAKLDSEGGGHPKFFKINMYVYNNVINKKIIIFNT